MTRWLVAGYVLLTAWSTFQAIEPGGISSFLWAFAVLVSGGVLMAIVVQADSPYRADAFWAGHPFDARAMLLAKALFGAILIVIPLAGQAVALTAYGLPVEDLAVMLSTSVLLFAVGLATAAILAAVIPDLRTFLLAGAVLFIVENVIALSLAATGHALRLTAVLGATAWLAWLAAGFLLLGWFYRERRRGPAAGLVIVLLAVSAVLGSWDAEPGNSITGDVPEAQRAAIEVTGLGRGSEGLDVQIRLTRRGSDEVAYSLVDATARITTRSGQSFDTRARVDRVRLNVPDVPIGGRAPFGFGSGDMSYVVPFTLTPEQRGAIADGIAGVEVSGRLELLRHRVAFSLPLHEGSRATEERRRVRILEIEEVPDEMRLQLSQTTIRHPWLTREFAGVETVSHLPRYSLVDDSRNEVVRLQPTGSSSGSAFLVLPGASSNREVIRLTTRAPFRDSVATHEPWADRSRLVAIEWLPVGALRVTASFTVR